MRDKLLTVSHNYFYITGTTFDQFLIVPLLQNIREIKIK